MERQFTLGNDHSHNPDRQLGSTVRGGQQSLFDRNKAKH